MKTEQKPNIDFVTFTEAKINYFYAELETNTLKIEAITLKEHNTPEQKAFFEALLIAISKAKRYDVLQFKRSQGGRKSSQNMTAEQRSERARRAGSTKKKSRQKSTSLYSNQI